MVAATPVSPDVIERFRRLESALIYDVLDSMGLPHQQLSLDIQPLDINMIVAGPAFTSKATVSEAGRRVPAARPTPTPPHRVSLPGPLYAGGIPGEDGGQHPLSRRARANPRPSVHGSGSVCG